MKNTILLARHGETLNNRAKRLSGWIDTPLTENGLIPAETVITKLSTIIIDTVYSSDLGRAFITADFIARRIGYNKEIIRLAGLREVNYGDAANMFSYEAYERFPGLDSDTHYAPPNGESLKDMQARTLQSIIATNRKIRGGF